MRTFYSILYTTLNTALNERVSMGLLMSNGENNIFKFSQDKLTATKGLLELESYNFIKKYLQSLEKDINTKEAAKGIFKNEAIGKDWTDESYIRYLAKYSNNLIQFSEPKTIDINYNLENYKKVFEKYIHAYQQEDRIIKVDTIYDKVKLELYPKIEKHVNLDFKLDASHFKNLIAPIKINFIGINNVTTAGQTIDFDKSKYHLENDITRFITLTNAIDLKENKKGTYFILGSEPEKKNYKNHSVWEQIKDSDFLKFIDVNEIEIIESYMDKHEVKPYFSK